MIQFDVTVSKDKTGGLNIFPLRVDADAKLAAIGFVKFGTIYPFQNHPLVRELLEEVLDLLIDPTYLEEPLL